MNTQNAHTEWSKVKELKNNQIRKSIPKECYTRSLFKSVFWLIVDLLLFAVGISLIFITSSIALKLSGGLIAGVGAASLAVWAHDAAHGSLFKNKKVAEFLGTIAMFPSFHIYRMWSYGHNKVHHGFTSFTAIDWIWRPLTPKEYKKFSLFQRFLYKMERNIFTCAFHYLRKVWWRDMLQFNPGKGKEGRRYYGNGKLYVFLYVVAASIITYFFAGGIIGIISAVLLPFIVFTYFMSMIVYLHHTHPDIPFFDLKKEWSPSIGVIYCSTIIHCSKPAQLLLHNIMIHIPHHLDSRIPFYHLPKAYNSLKEEYGEYFHEYTFKWSNVYTIFKKCKLYDFEKKLWFSFKEAKSLPKSV